MRHARYRQTGNKKTGVHPIWRGIGCILFLLTPILSIAIANVVVLSGFLQQYIRFPRNLMQTVTVPFIDYQIRAFNATMIVAGVVMILFFAIYFTLYAGLYRLMGPSPYGPTDVPPVRRKGRSRKSR